MFLHSVLWNNKICVHYFFVSSLRANLIVNYIFHLLLICNKNVGRLKASLVVWTNEPHCPKLIEHITQKCKCCCCAWLVFCLSDPGAFTHARVDRKTSSQGTQSNEHEYKRKQRRRENRKLTCAAVRALKLSMSCSHLGKSPWAWSESLATLQSSHSLPLEVVPLPRAFSQICFRHVLLGLSCAVDCLILLGFYSRSVTLSSINCHVLWRRWLVMTLERDSWSYECHKFSDHLPSHVPEGIGNAGFIQLSNGQISLSPF